LLTEVEQVLNGCALTAYSDDPHDFQPIRFRSRFVWKDKPVPSKKVEAGAISGGSVLEEGVVTVSSIIGS